MADSRPSLSSRLEAALDREITACRGPGGLIGLVQDGQVLARRAWGYGDLARALPMDPTLRLPICSISKQFTCATLLAEIGEPELLDPDLPAYLPAFEGPRPSVRQLCHNQSGLRDYWALTVLDGALAEQSFPREAALPMIARLRSGHFPPGSSYSYCNCNFRLLGEMIEARAKAPLEELYQRHIWGPAGMTGAELTPDTRHPLDGVVGYEGSPEHGFLPADNGIYWRGDAGISASLNDMLAYERWIDATRDDPAGLYRRISQQPRFVDGNLAWYGFGLAHEEIAGQHVTGHGGALRGFRLQRLHCAAARLSVVVLFNHEADAHGCARRLAEAVLSPPEDQLPPAPLSALPPEGDWCGDWIDPERNMLARLSPAGPGRTALRLQYFTGTSELEPGAPDPSGAPVLRAEGLELCAQEGGLALSIRGENTTRRLVPVPKAPEPEPHAPETPVAQAAGVAGRYRSLEMDMEMEIELRDGAGFVRFGGALGQGAMEPLYPIAPDLWELVTRRSMDAPAPGSWTLRVLREAGTVCGVQLSCWLARDIRYRKLPE